MDNAQLKEANKLIELIIALEIGYLFIAIIVSSIEIASGLYIPTNIDLILWTSLSIGIFITQIILIFKDHAILCKENIKTL